MIIFTNGAACEIGNFLPKSLNQVVVKNVKERLPKVYCVFSVAGVIRGI